MGIKKVIKALEDENEVNSSVSTETKNTNERDSKKSTASTGTSDALRVPEADKDNTLYDTVLVVFDPKAFFHSNNFTDTLNAFKFRTLRLNSNIKVAVFCSDAVIWCKYDYAITLVHWKFMDETVIAHNLEFLSREKIFQEYENHGILCNVAN